MLQYMVFESNYDNNTVTIKGVYSTSEKAKKLMKNLYKNNNDYFNRDTKYDNILPTKIVAIDSNDIGGGTYASVTYSVEEIEFEMDQECDIEIG